MTSSQQLLDSFRPVDRDEVELPEDMVFPLAVTDYLAWSEPSGYRMYLLIGDEEKRTTLGVVFRRDQTAGGTAPPHMCEWCHSVRGGNQVGLLTATAASHRRIGLQLCRDLSCKDKLESEPGVNDFPGAEFQSVRERRRKVVRRMMEFARRHLF